MIQPQSIQSHKYKLRHLNYLSNDSIDSIWQNIVFLYYFNNLNQTIKQNCNHEAGYLIILPQTGFLDVIQENPFLERKQQDMYSLVLKNIILISDHRIQLNMFSCPPFMPLSLRQPLVSPRHFFLQCKTLNIQIYHCQLNAQKLFS